MALAEEGDDACRKLDLSNLEKMFILPEPPDSFSLFSLCKVHAQCMIRLELGYKVLYCTTPMILVITLPSFLISLLSGVLF